MRRVAILASVLAMAIGSAYCSSSGSSPLSPSTADASAAATDARGGGGGKGKPGGATGEGSLSLVMVADTNANGAPNWGDTITWNTSGTDTPVVGVECTQNGVLVYVTTGGLYPTYDWPWTANMLLKSGAWTGGGATCTAKLTPVSGTPLLATYSFSVAP